MDVNAKVFAAYWPLEDVRLGPILQQYPTRTTRALQARQGRFVVKVYQDEFALGLVSPSLDQIAGCLSVLDYLAEQGFRHAPALVRTRSGNSFVQRDGWTAYLMTYVEGRTPPRSVDTFHDLGRVAARLSTCWDYPHPYPISVPGTIQELAAQAEDYPFREEFLRVVEWLAPLEGQPASLIHAEINPPNAIRARDGTMVLLDWDTAGRGPTVLMSGYPLIVTLVGESDCRFHRDWAVAFYTGFTVGRGMTVEEKEMVFRAALLHALRYLRVHNTAARWARVQYALAHRDELLSVIPSR